MKTRLFCFLALVLSGCGQSESPSLKVDKQIEFCKNVIDVVKSDDPQCAPYLGQIKKEIEEEKARQARMAARRPSIYGRSSGESCSTASAECQKWTSLARSCAENMRQRDEGFMGRQEDHCTQMERYREQVTGVADSSAPGAYDF